MDETRRKLLVTVAHMHYIQGLTQKEIAARLELTCSNVSRLIRQSAEQGVVEFRINDPSAKTLGLEQQILSAFRLRGDCVIVPTGTTLMQSKAELAAAVVKYLSEHLKENARLGVGWGTTIHAVAQALRSAENIKAADVVQLVGCIGMHDTDTDGDIIVREFARYMSARPHILAAPFFVQSMVLKTMLVSEPHIARHIARFDSLDAVLAGFGATTGASSLSAIFKSGLISDPESNALKEAGSAGDLCGLQFTKTGRQVQNAVAARVIGINKAQMAKVPRVYGMAVGPAKVDATIACLRSGLVHTVFLDEALAQAVLSVI